VDTSTILALALATAVAAGVAFPISRALNVHVLTRGQPRRAGYLLTNTDPSRLVMDLVAVAAAVKREGPAGLADVLAGVRDPLMSRALSLAVSGASSDAVRDELERLCAVEDGARSEMLARLALPVGVMGGTLLAFVILVVHLSGGSVLGAGAATMVLVAMYGSFIAQGVLAHRTSGGHGVATGFLVREILVAGVLAIREGAEPNVVRARLLGLLPSAEAPTGRLAKAA
jgi:flagellar motor component MotA